MRFIITTLALLAAFAFIGCSSINSPEAATLDGLDFSGFEARIQTDTHPGDMMFVVTFDSDNVVTDICPESEYVPNKDGDDDTEVKVTWSELKALYR